VPSVVAVGDVLLKPRTRVIASIATGGTVAQHPSSSVGGTVSTNAEVRAKTAVPWRVTIPGAGEGNDRPLGTSKVMSKVSLERGLAARSCLSVATSVTVDAAARSVDDTQSKERNCTGQRVHC